MTKPRIVEVRQNPYCIIIRNVFGKELTKKMLDEFRQLKKQFTDAVIVGKTGSGEINKKIRSNQVAYYDTIFFNRRHQSILLKVLDDFVKSQWLHELLNSAPMPFCYESQTNWGETQISRYGNTNEKYDWHIDRINNNDSRLITFSYYVAEVPKKFKGGEIILSNGLLANQMLHAETNRHKIAVENDMVVIFDSRTPHCVMPTKSPKEFTSGRFSVQRWLGFAPQSQ